MIPKVDFQIHETLIEAFYLPKLWGGDREELDKEMKNFIDLFRIHEEMILTLIQKYSGFEWSKERIPVFLVPDSRVLLYSFTKSTLQDGLPGIIQKIFKDKNSLIFSIFIHELCHVNQHQSDFYDKKYKTADEKWIKDTDRVELSADLVMLYVVREIFGNNSEYEKAEWDFLKNTNDRNKKKGEMLEKYMPLWDLNKMPLKSYLEM
jgi:hypothetical protein